MKSTIRFVLPLLGLALSAAVPGMDRDPTVQLPKPSADGGLSLESAIRERRSIRKFSSRSLSLADVAQLLWAAQGVTARDGRRTAPSAGALYPLELYLVAGSVDSLPTGVYRYLPGKHRLRRIAAGDLRGPLAEAALDQSWVRRAPTVMVITGVYERSAKKYGQRARRYTHIEVGHTAQNVYLQAVGLELGTVVVGAFDDAGVREALNLPPDHAPLALMPIGHTR